jgi:hypothetical protein
MLPDAVLSHIKRTRDFSKDRVGPPRVATACWSDSQRPLIAQRSRRDGAN